MKFMKPWRFALSVKQRIQGSMSGLSRYNLARASFCAIVVHPATHTIDPQLLEHHAEKAKKSDDLSKLLKECVDTTVDDTSKHCMGDVMRSVELGKQVHLESKDSHKITKMLWASVPPDDPVLCRRTSKSGGIAYLHFFNLPSHAHNVPWLQARIIRKRLELMRDKVSINDLPKTCM
jgi:hypothetical protein